MQIKYVAKISSQGENYVLWIPKEFHKQVEKLKGKQVRVVIDDEW